jgi:hypothetical protein
MIVFAAMPVQGSGIPANRHIKAMKLPSSF